MHVLIDCLWFNGTFGKIRLFSFYILTSVCVRALPVGHYWSQAKRRAWSLSSWILLLRTVSY